ncbi:MAG TPA: transposase [Opitutaceae bacterium]|nr:transposase [Opitutaceae bacterium]
MHWLQSTFATRFNRFRRESGHVFQGRFKAIVVETERDLANVAHYIHLNPVRAGIVSTDQLDLYPYSSYVYFRKEERASCLNPTACLAGAGELKDNSADWELYHKYLSWLAESDEEIKRLQFDDLSKGWAIGSPEFRREAARIINEATSAISTGCRTRTEAKEIGWEVLLERALVQLGRNTHDVAVDKKSADWKVAIAAHLKAHTTAKNPWLAHQLNMGDPDGVSRYVSECRSGKRKQAKMLLAKITDIRDCPKSRNII